MASPPALPRSLDLRLRGMERRREIQEPQYPPDSLARFKRTQQMSMALAYPSQIRPILTVSDPGTNLGLGR